MTPTKNAPVELPPSLALKGQLSMTKDVLLTGTFEGDLKTAGCVTVPAGGAATGTIEAGALILEPGNQVVARVKIGTTAVRKPTTVARKTGNKWVSGLKKLKELALGRR